MRRLASLIAACLASLLLYGLVFGFVVHKPLTIDIIADLLKLKSDYARRVGSPKLVIFAGSNARYSHRCQTIEPLLKMPCVNFGVARGIGLDYLLGDLEPLLHAGDIVYMPLEAPRAYIRATAGSPPVGSPRCPPRVHRALYGPLR